MCKENSVSSGIVPIEVKSGLAEFHSARFQKQFIELKRDELELLWRRTQQPETEYLSGMIDESDRRRRMIHGLDRYAVIQVGNSYSLAITDPHVWYQTVSPFRETSEYLQSLQMALEHGCWQREEAGIPSEYGAYRLNDLTLRYEVKDREEEDIKEGRTFPPGYNILEVEINGGRDKTEEQKKNQWGILRSGMRTKDVRGNPRIMKNLRHLEHYFPMQVELGCGPSIEAGIPPLHYFHTLYQVSEPIKGTFIFGPNKDTFLSDIISNPLYFYIRSSVLYSAALTTEPTPFYYLMRELFEKKIIVGDVITNNFDGLCTQVDLKERYVRRFDEPKFNLYPEVDFHPEARSLLVVGAHADRRKIEKSAREKGLQVIYVDPEGYIEPNTEKFIPYPLESIQDDDYLIPVTAAQFTDAWKSTYK